MSSARYVVVACTAKDRWFDLDAERGEGFAHNEYNKQHGGRIGTKGPNTDRGDLGAGNFHSPHSGAPPLDCWLIDDDDPPPTTEEPPMSEARFLIGDVFDRMAELPDNSVDLIVTSPPFLALRSYLPADHPDKGKEIGSEPTPAAFLSTLLALTREWRRILTPTGSLCVELGDTYSGSGGAGGDYDLGGIRNGAPKFSGSALADRKNKVLNANGQRMQQGTGWPLDKSLCLIPSLFAGSLAYGRNLLNPDDRIEPMRVRNQIIWHRPNPPVGALGDKVRPSTSYVTVACTAKDRWFDLDSERTEPTSGTAGAFVKNRSAASAFRGVTDGSNDRVELVSNPAGAPLLDAWIHDDVPDADVWTIPTAPYAGSHYATFPPALPRRLINLMCPRQVCTSCGEPRRRITSEPEYVSTNGGRVVNQFKGERRTDGRASGEYGTQWTVPGGNPGHAVRVAETLGWSECKCPYPSELKWRRGIVLDPFAGSGTTLQAASELGRDSIGIDLDESNVHLAQQRCGMFLQEVDYGRSNQAIID